MMPSSLQPLLAPLERFEAIRRKLMPLGDRVCDLSYANPYQGASEAARAVLREALDAQRLLDLQYSPIGGHTIPRRILAAHLVRHFGRSYTFEDVALTPGATAALHVALRVAGQPGDEVIIPVPCWLDYPPYVRAVGLTPVLVPLAEGSFELDAAGIARAVTPRTCAVLFSHPANPTGRAYDQQTLTALRDALADRERTAVRPITLIADEVHRDFAPAGYVSATAAWPRTLTVYSFGKYHFLQGQRLGYVAVSPDHPQRRDVAAELVRWMRVLGFMAPTTVMQRALPGLLDLRHDVTEMRVWRARFAAELTAAGYAVAPGDGTFFLYARVPGGATDDFAFVEQLGRAGVLALPAPVFHHEGYFRLALTGTSDMLERALARLCHSSVLCASCA